METQIEPRDGAWRLGEAGEVEFLIRDGALDFIDARDTSGWTHTIGRNTGEAIEVQFLKGEVEWAFAAYYDQGQLEVRVQQEHEPAEPGTYTLGSAGEVEIGLEDGALSLVDTSPNVGWHQDIVTDTSERIEVAFSQGGVEWRLTATLEAGLLTVKSQCVVAGPVTPDPMG